MRPAIGYIRVSTAKQRRSGLGIEAQQEALQRIGTLTCYDEFRNGSRDHVC